MAVLKVVAKLKHIEMVHKSCQTKLNQSKSMKDALLVTHCY